MLAVNISTRIVRSVISRKISKHSTACQLVLSARIHSTTTNSSLPRLRSRSNVDGQFSSGQSRVLQVVCNHNDGQEARNAIFISLVKKLLFPLFSVISSNRIRNMYANQTLKPPEDVRGMKVLDVNAFRKMVLIPGLRVPNKQTGIAVGKLKNILLKMPGIKSIAEVSEDDPEHHTHKLFLFDPEKIKSIELFLKEREDVLNSCNINKESVQLYELELGYKNWTHHDVLRAVLPKQYDGVAGFSSVGHILHLNLRNEIMDYKHVIGKVLLDKIPTARTVVNKLDVIDSTFRNFEMEVLAGDGDFVTVTKENGLSYKLDFSKVYWNPRLGTEHQRVVSLLQPQDIVLDVFAGIGPFAVPAAKKKCTVYANDLNPHSYHWLEENLTLNKVKGDYRIYNMDGREFIRTVVKDKLVHHWSQEAQCDGMIRYQIIMNLPAMAVQFLDAFRGLFASYSSEQREKWPSYSEPEIYCYAFTKAEDGKKDAVEQAERFLGAPLGSEHVVRFVRQVAPNKDMFCIMFRPSSELLFGSTSSQQVADSEPPTKKPKTELEVL